MCMRITNPELGGALVPVFLAAHILFVNTAARRAPPPAVPPLSGFPASFGQWKLFQHDPIASEVSTELKGDRLLTQTCGPNPPGPLARC